MADTEYPDELVERVARAFNRAELEFDFDGVEALEEKAWDAYGHIYMLCARAGLSIAGPEIERRLIAELLAANDGKGDLALYGLEALVAEIQRRGRPLPNVVDGQELTDSEAAQRYMQLGAEMRSGREVEACVGAFVRAFAKERGIADD